MSDALTGKKYKSLTATRRLPSTPSGKVSGLILIYTRNLPSTLAGQWKTYWPKHGPRSSRRKMRQTSLEKPTTVTMEVVETNESIESQMTDGRNRTRQATEETSSRGTKALVREALTGAVFQGRVDQRWKHQNTSSASNQSTSLQL